MSLVFLFAGNEDAQVIRFQAGDTDIMSRINAENYALLSRDAQSAATSYSISAPAWNTTSFSSTSMT